MLTYKELILPLSLWTLHSILRKKMLMAWLAEYTFFYMISFWWICVNHLPMFYRTIVSSLLTSWSYEGLVKNVKILWNMPLFICSFSVLMSYFQKHNKYIPLVSTKTTANDVVHQFEMLRVTVCVWFLFTEKAWFGQIDNDQGLNSLCGKPSYRKISWSFAATSLGGVTVVSLCNLIGTLVAGLTRCL